MKKITMFFSALLFSLMSMAASIDFSAQGYENAQVIESATIADGLVVTFAKATSANPPTYYTSGTAVRVYGGATMTVTATGSTISKIVLTYGTSDKTNAITTDCGTFDTDTWTGSASAVTFTVDGTSGHRRIKAIEVTLGESSETPEEPETPETPTVPEGVITCVEAVAICQETGETATSEQYTIRGYVTNIASAYNAGYNNTSFWMADTKDGGKVFEAFRSTPVNEADKAVKVGDYVEVTGNLVNYKGNTPETAQGGTYTILEAAEGGDDPIDPEEPETPEAKPLTDGYTKVTATSALANGDKVVLYCDAYAVGVAGFDGNKTGIMAETGWVEYIIEVVVGGVKLKDEAAGQYAALPESNSFKYNEEGSVFNVTENAMLSAVLDGDTYYLYRNANSKNSNPLCRMYKDKTGQAEYAPFYVYEVTENTGNTDVENVAVDQNITKFIENGQLIILKNGVRYNILGAVVK